jgi:hypothetical protein
VRYGNDNVQLCVQHAAGGMRRAAGGSSNDGEGNAQAAAACSNVRQCVAILLLW